MSNLLVRSISSVAFVILILGPLLISERVAFTVYAVLGGFTLIEVIRLSSVQPSRTQWILSFSIYMILALMAYGLFFLPATNFRQGLLILSFILLLLAAFEVFAMSNFPLQRVLTLALAPALTGMSFLLIPYFFTYRSDLPGILLTVSVFALIWINDSAAYLVGRKIGKTKLLERVSPNKSREGSAAGLLFAVLAGYGMSYLEGMPSPLFMIGFALVCVLFGSLGDLFESRIKRATGVKDSGVFLPGHGGFFDRFDAMMLAVPAALIYFEAFLPKP